MEKDKIKLKEVYRREVFLALFLFGLSFLPLLHLLFPQTSLPTLRLLGLTFDGTIITYQVLIWELLMRLVFTVYSLLFYYLSNNRFKPLILVLFHLNTFELFYFLLYPIKELATITMVNYIALICSMITVFSLHFLTDLKIRFKTKESLFPRKKVIIDFLIAAVIMVFFVGHRLPVFRNKQILELPFFAIGSFGFPSIDTFLWVLGFKISFLSINILWFIREKKWWRYALLSPILVTIHQIRITLTPNEFFFDEFEFLNSFPLFALVVFVLLLLSKNAKNQYYFKAVYDEAVERIEKRALGKYHKRSNRIKEIKEKIENLKASHSDVSPTELLDLKKELEKQLKRI